MSNIFDFFRKGRLRKRSKAYEVDIMKAGFNSFEDIAKNNLENVQEKKMEQSCSHGYVEKKSDELDNPLEAEDKIKIFQEKNGGCEMGSEPKKDPPRNTRENAQEKIVCTNGQNGYIEKESQIVEETRGEGLMEILQDYEQDEIDIGAKIRKRQIEMDGSSFGSDSSIERELDEFDESDMSINERDVIYVSGSYSFTSVETVKPSDEKKEFNVREMKQSGVDLQETGRLDSDELIPTERLTVERIVEVKNFNGEGRGLVLQVTRSESMKSEEEQLEDEKRAKKEVAYRKLLKKRKIAEQMKKERERRKKEFEYFSKMPVERIEKMQKEKAAVKTEEEKKRKEQREARIKERRRLKTTLISTKIEKKLFKSYEDGKYYLVNGTFNLLGNIHGEVGQGAVFSNIRCKKEDLEYSYEGGWHDGRYHGNGHLSIKTGAENQREVTGRWNYGRYKGGEINFKTLGEVMVKYKGEVNDNYQLHGKGELEVPSSGFIYKGYFSEDEPIEVVISKKNGEEIFEGRMKNWSFDDGTLYYPAGHKRGLYSGTFKNGKPSGHGIVKYKDFSVYTGEMADGLRHGAGTMKGKIDKYEFIGNFKKGKRHGKGKTIIYTPKNRRFAGMRRTETYEEGNITFWGKFRWVRRRFGEENEKK